LKLKYFLLLLIILSSCKDDISNGNFRNENYVFYQENGKAGEWLKINPELEINLPKSHSTYFFPNGNRFAELKVIDSFPNRILKYFNKEDKLIRIVKYESDSIVSKVFENGYYKGYHSNLGLLQSEGLIENHMYQGKWKFYRKDGKTIKQIVEYINDTLHGIREDYWENGNLKSKVINVKGKLNGNTFHYYKNGQLEESNSLKEDEFHGIMKHYYENGKLEYIRKYWKGHRIDTSKSFFKNGNINRLSAIEFDTITLTAKGREYKYFESGELNFEADFIDFIANGELIIYNEKGIIIEHSHKLNNKHHGEFIRYYDSGIKYLEGSLNNGFFHGKVKTFNEKGKLIKTVVYSNGTALDSIMY